MNKNPRIASREKRKWPISHNNFTLVDLSRCDVAACSAQVPALTLWPQIFSQNLPPTPIYSQVTSPPTYCEFESQLVLISVVLIVANHLLVLGFDQLTCSIYGFI